MPRAAHPPLASTRPRPSTVRPLALTASQPLATGRARTVRLAARGLAARMLREACVAAGVSSTDLGAALDMHPSAVRAVLSGDRLLDLGQLGVLIVREPRLAPALVEVLRLYPERMVSLARCAA